MIDLKNFLHRHNRRLFQAAAVFAAACLITVNAGTALIYATTAQDKLNDAEEGLSDAQDDIDEITQNQDELENEIADAETQLASILANLEQLDAQIEETEEAVAQTEEELEAAKEAEAEQYESMKLRIQYMYENNTADSIWQAILESNGFVDMLNRLEYVAQVNQADREMMDAYEAAVEAVEQKKQELEEEMDNLLYQQEIYVGQQGEVEALIEELGDKADEYASQLAAAQALADSYQATIEEQSAIIAAEAAAQQAAAEAAAKEAAEKAAAEAAAAEAAAAAAAEAANSSDDSDDSDTSESAGDTSSDDSSSTTSGSSSSTTTNSSGVSGQDIVNYALQFVGNPYVWGGNSLTNGCDCSGFVHQVLAHFGISSPRYSQSFALYGTAVSRSDIQAGDIVVYSGHVAIYIGNGCIVEAQSTRAGITCTRSVDCSTILAIRRYV